LYPRPWRERYGDEVGALLEARPPSLLDRIDLIRGALDARLHPQVGLGAPVPDDRADRTGSRLAIAGGILITLYAIGLAIVAPRWNSVPTTPEALRQVVSLAGFAGIALAAASAAWIGFGRAEQLGRSGGFGAGATVVGLILVALGAGLPAEVVLVVGAISFASGISGAVVPWRVRIGFAGLTILQAAGVFAFVVSGGQDLRLLWAVVPYGMAWVLLGLTLRPRGTETTAA